MFRICSTHPTQHPVTNKLIMNQICNLCLRNTESYSLTFCSHMQSNVPFITI